MFITFSMAVMRMSGAIGFNPLFGKSNFPVKIRAYFIFALSLLLYLSADQTQMAYPGSMAEYILMLAGELFLGAVLAFAMELAFLTIRFASSIMDYSMGLSMAQVYDPVNGQFRYLLCIYGTDLFCQQQSFTAVSIVLPVGTADPFWKSDI